ncbi:MAG: hypothetical protein NG740_05635 [Omnitrophica bacterium]|nr:hypothetical protein [Candidatus Omnitrophota bacterium]
MQNLILLILCILVTGFIGWNVLYLLSGRKGFERFFAAEKIGLSYLLGFGVITIQMFIMGLLGMRFTRLAILLPWVFVAAVNLARGLRRSRSEGRGPFRFCVTDLALIALIALQTCYNFFRALIKPIEAYDSVAIYGLKAKIMHLAGGLPPDFFRALASNFHGAHPDYPLLIPLSEVWVYTFLGNFNDILVKAIFPLFYLSFILVFYAVLKRITENVRLSLLFTFALASIKQFSDYSTIGVADLVLGIYFGAALFYLYAWIKDNKNTQFLNISLIFSILCAWSKNEGIFLLYIVLSLLFLYLFSNIGKIPNRVKWHLALYALFAVALSLSWMAFKNYHGLVNENFDLAMLNIGRFITGLKKIPAIMYEYQKQFFGFKKWNIIWILFAFVLFKRARTAVSGNIRLITAAFLLFGLGYTLMYIFSAVEIAFFVRFTGSRFLLHILPVSVFWMAVIYSGEGICPEK